jgi:hypothetical protein
VIDEGQWHKATKTPKQKKTPETTERWIDFSGVVSGEDGSGAPLQRSHFNHQKGRFNGSFRGLRKTRPPIVSLSGKIARMVFPFQA